MRVALVQFNIQWKDKAANFKRIKELVEDVEADLFVLPETFQTGFAVKHPELAEEIDGETIAFLQEISKAKNSCFVGSFLCKAGEQVVNRFVAINAGEIVHYYDKIHLFIMGEEDKYISSGDGVADFDLNGFKIRPLVCYDLRFPYVSHNTSSYDILLYVANWPSKRISHWDALLAARAIENQAYVIACNRVGEQDGYFYPGHSSVISPTGDAIVHTHKEEVVIVEIDKTVVDKTREKLPFLSDQMQM